MSSKRTRESVFQNALAAIKKAVVDLEESKNEVDSLIRAEHLEVIVGRLADLLAAAQAPAPVPGNSTIHLVSRLRAAADGLLEEKGPETDRYCAELAKDAAAALVAKFGKKKGD